MKKFRSALLFATVGFFYVWADQEAAPASYTRGSADGRYIFVMLAEETPVEDDWGRGYFMTHEMASELRNRYPSSGMYRNDGSTIPEWTVDWYAFSVDIAIGGEYIVRHGPWPARGNYDEEAVSIFKNGKLIKTHTIRDLVDFPMFLPSSVSHFSWFKEGHIDQPMVGEYKLTTLHGESHRIILESGDIFESKWPSRIKLSTLAASIILLALSIVIYRRKCVNKPNKPRQ